MYKKNKEIWKDVKDYECLYQISNLGNVKSLDRIDSNGHRLKGKILKSGLSSSGYLTVMLSKNNTPKTFQVHQLVAIAFLNHTRCKQKKVVNHINFNKTDNNSNNLEIVSFRENSNQKHIKSSSKYTGVSWCKSRKKWHAGITIEGKAYNLGRYDSELEAHITYQNKLNELPTLF